jgi:hypothetical protein
MLAATLALALGAPSPAVAQSGRETTADGSFRFEWEVVSSRKGPRLDAYVYNLMLRPVQNVRVRIERLDATAGAESASTVQVWGIVQAGDRGFFQVPGAMPGARYRFSVLNYDLAPVGGASG